MGVWGVCPLRMGNHKGCLYASPFCFAKRGGCAALSHEGEGSHIPPPLDARLRGYDVGRRAYDEWWVGIPREHRYARSRLFRSSKEALGGLAGVEGGCLVCGGLGFFGVGAGVDGGFCPCVAAVGDESDAFGGEGEFFGFRLFEVGIGCVQDESEEGDLPAYAGGAGAVGIPEIRQNGGMGEGKACLAPPWGASDISPASGGTVRRSSTQLVSSANSHVRAMCDCGSQAVMVPLALSWTW